MLHPSYSELMARVNKDSEGEAPIVSSRYSIVMASAERAKQIIEATSIYERIQKRNASDASDNELRATREEFYALKIGEPKVEGMEKRKPLSIAVEELFKGAVKIVDKKEDNE